MLYRDGNYQGYHSTIVGTFSDFETAKKVGKIFLKKEKETDPKGYNSRQKLMIIKKNIDILRSSDVFKWLIDRSIDMIL